MVTAPTPLAPLAGVTSLLYRGLPRPRPLPQRNVTGLTFFKARHADTALGKLTVEEAEERIQFFQNIIEQGDCRPENKDFFIDQMLLNNRRPISEPGLMILAAHASGVGLLHLAKRADLTENVNLVAAVNNIARHLNGERSIHAPFQNPQLPAWMMRLGLETELVNPRGLSDGDQRHRLFAYTLPSGMLENPALPLLARAHLTIPEIWDWPEFAWCADGKTTMKPHLQEEVAVQFPDLADLPAGITIATLRTLPLDDNWGVVPPQHQLVADMVREAIQVRRTELAEGL